MKKVSKKTSIKNVYKKKSSKAVEIDFTNDDVI